MSHATLKSRARCLPAAITSRLISAVACGLKSPFSSTGCRLRVIILFGANEFAARLPSAVAAIVTVALLYFALRYLGLPRVALAASLVLSTSGIFIAYARVAVPDMILTTAMTAALFAALLWTKATGRARVVYLTLSFGFMGLGMLAKGLVGIVLVLAILAIYLFATGQLRSVRWRECLIGFAAFLLVAGTWYVPVTMRHGWSFIDEFFIRHHLQRYTSNEFGHPQPFYFFFLVALAGAAPWMFFLIPAVARLRSLRPRIEARDSLLLLAWIWIAVPLIFFSFSVSKLPGYILPISPALAIVLGPEVERIWNGGAWPNSEVSSLDDGARADRDMRRVSRLFAPPVGRCQRRASAAPRFAACDCGGLGSVARRAQESSVNYRGRRTSG